MLKISRRTLLGSSCLAAVAASLPYPLVAVAAAAPQYDAIVAGGGIAGLAATLEAASHGKKVLLLTAQPMLGGNTYLSTGLFTACNSPVQLKLSKEKDSPEQFAADSLAISNGLRDPMWTKIVAEHSAADVAWLVENGVVYEDYVGASMGSPKPRVIQVKGYGRGLVTALSAAIAKTGNVEIRTETRVKSLLVSDGKLTGVAAETNGKEVQFFAKNVILATGGFAGNKELVKKYAPKLSAFGSVGDPNLRGDGLVMTTALGAQTRHLEIINVVPTTDKKTKIYLTSAALSGGGILVNEKGERFCNELKNYTDTGLAMAKQERVYEILVPECHAKVKTLVEKQMLSKADSVAELAKAINVPEAALAETLKRHNAATRGEEKDKFGRSIYKNELKAPLYWMEVMPMLLQSFGGIVTNEKAQVLSEKGTPLFPNLFAAGELVSGYLDGGYRSGDALMFGTVSGRIAAQSMQ